MNKIGVNNMIEYGIKQKTIKGEKYKVLNNGIVEYCIKQKTIICDKIKLEK
jgi:hypothetical protein